MNVDVRRRCPPDTGAVSDDEMKRGQKRKMSDALTDKPDCDDVTDSEVDVLISSHLVY